MVHLWERKCHDLPEAVLSHIVSDILSRKVHKNIIQCAAKATKEYQSDHL